MTNVAIDLEQLTLLFLGRFLVVITARFYLLIQAFAYGGVDQFFRPNRRVVFFLVRFQTWSQHG